MKKWSDSLFHAPKLMSLATIGDAFAQIHTCCSSCELKKKNKYWQKGTWQAQQYLYTSCRPRVTKCCVLSFFLLFFFYIWKLLQKSSELSFIWLVACNWYVVIYKKSEFKIKHFTIPFHYPSNIFVEISWSFDYKFNDF